MSQLDRRQLLRLIGGLAVAGAAGAVTGCTAQPQGTEMEQPSGVTIKIGFIAPALGAYSRVGDEITKGINLFLGLHNNLLATNNVDLHLVEEGTSADSAVAAAKTLINAGVLAIGGVANPNVFDAVADAAEAAHIPLVSTVGSPTSFASHSYTWRSACVQGEAGRALGTYAMTTGNTAYVLMEDSPGARAEANAFIAVYRGAGGTVIGPFVVAPGSFTSRVQSADSSAASVIFGAFSGDNALAMLAAYAQVNPAIQLIGPASLTESVDLTKLKTLPDHVFTSSFYAPDLDNDENQRFVSAYHDTNGVQPTSYAMAAYDTASILDKAMRLTAGSLDGPNLNVAFNLLGRIDSPRGPWSFNTNRSPQQKWYLRRLRLDGQIAANLLDNDLAVLS